MKTDKTLKGAPEEKEIIITVPNYAQGALQEQILYILKKYKYANHEKPRLLSVDTWSNSYSVILHTPITGGAKQ